MNITVEYALFVAALLLGISILASKISTRLGIPALLLFLVIGMVAGSEGAGGIYFDDPWLAQSLGVVALAFILFSGGLSTHFDGIRPALAQGVALSTVGVLVNALVIGAIAHVLLDFSLTVSVLLGAIVSPTDAAAVFAILRGKNIGLRPPLQPLLELESGSNDPMAIFLTLGLIRLAENPETSILSLLPLFVRQMALGALIGYLVGRGLVEVINRVRLEYDGLYPVITIAAVLLAYGATTVVGGNGFLAVYLAGVVCGNHNFIHKRSLGNFHDGIAWLMQIVMFLTLGLLVFPSRLLSITGQGLLLAAGLILVARPLAVFASLARSSLPRRGKIFVSWVGLRGAAPIVLATFPLLAGIPQASAIFNLVFFIVLTSVLVQGTTLPVVARWLGVQEARPRPVTYPIESVSHDDLKSEMIELVISDHAPVVNRQLIDVDLPENTLVVLLSREGDLVIPRGSTVFQAGDRVLVLADKDTLADVRARLGADLA